jgi:hypothetical protein
MSFPESVRKLGVMSHYLSSDSGVVFTREDPRNVRADYYKLNEESEPVLISTVYARTNRPGTYKKSG